MFVMGEAAVRLLANAELVLGLVEADFVGDGRAALDVLGAGRVTEDFVNLLERQALELDISLQPNVQIRGSVPREGGRWPTDTRRRRST